jgi:2'-5' RNA ligase
VDADERLRLFVALPLPPESRDRLVAWQSRALGAAGDARIVPPENLHVTLAFLGSRPRSDVAAILDALRAAAADVDQPTLRSRRYRETRSVGMVVLDDDGDRATRLAADVGERLAALGVYRPERRPWLAHVTVLRFRRPPRLSPEPPDLGEVSPSEAALYTSSLRRSGAQYDVLESVPLGG